MRGHDDLRSLRDGALHLIQVEVPRHEIAIHEHGFGACAVNHVTHGEEGHGRGNDFVARFETDDVERQFHRSRGGCHHAYRATAKEVGQRQLEGLDLGPGSDPV